MRRVRVGGGVQLDKGRSPQNSHQRDHVVRHLRRWVVFQSFSCPFHELQLMKTQTKGGLRAVAGACGDCWMDAAVDYFLGRDDAEPTPKRLHLSQTRSRPLMPAPTHLATTPLPSVLLVHVYPSRTDPQPLAHSAVFFRSGVNNTAPIQSVTGYRGAWRISYLSWVHRPICRTGLPCLQTAPKWPETAQIIATSRRALACRHNND